MGVDVYLLGWPVAEKGLLKGQGLTGHFRGQMPFISVAIFSMSDPESRQYVQISLK